MSWLLYGQLSLMMLLEFAVWGAWAPVLAAYLVRDLKFSGKQTGWIYSTLWLACIVSPFAGGQVADRWVATEHFLAAVHLIGGVLLLAAAWRRKFSKLFVLMLIYSLLYAPTLALSNSMMLVNLRKGARQADLADLEKRPPHAEELAAARRIVLTKMERDLADGETLDTEDPEVASQIEAGIPEVVVKDRVDKVVETQSGRIRVWGTIGWIIAGFILAGWRRIRKTVPKFSDCLLLAGILSLLLGVCCLTLPHTPPPEKPGDPLAFREAFKLLEDPNFLIFLIISFIVTTELQFYYVPTAPFLEDLGVQNRNVPAVMTLAQIAEIVGMAVLMPLLLPKLGYRWALAIGVIAWPARYVIFAIMKPLWLVISSLPLHGIGYTFFFFVGQVYVGKVAPEDIQGSAQALIAVATLGFGNFLGTQFTGIILDVFKTKEGKFRWRPIFLVPCVLTIACAIAFVALFRG